MQGYGNGPSTGLDQTAAGKIQTAMLIGAGMTEALSLYAFVISIIILFVA